MSDLVFTVDVDASSGVAAINEFFATVEKGSKAAGEKLRKSLGDQDVEKKVIITLEGGKAVAKEVKAVSSATDKIITAQKALNGEYGKTQKSVNEALGLLRQMKGTTVKFSADNKTISTDWKLINTRIREAENALRGLNSTSSNFGSSIQDVFGGLVAKITAANLASNALTLALKGVGSAFTFLFKEGLQFEQLNLQLEAFTGSAGGAQAAMDSFLKTAIETPLDVKQVASAGRVLMAFGLSVDQSKESVRSLAIVAGATGGQMDNLSRNLGQIAAQGRAFTRDLNQFAVQGIPIYGELAKVMGKSVEDIRAMAEEGSIGFTEVQTALDNMTREGTAFAEVAERMNNTFTGKIEEMISSVQLLAGGITKMAMDLDNTFGGPITKTMGAFSWTLQTIAKNMDTLKLAVGGLLVGLTTMGVVIAGMNLNTLLLGLGALGTVISGMLAPMKAWIAAKITMLGLMGPAGWAVLAAGVAAAGIAIVAMKNNMDQANQSAIEMGDSIESLTDEGMDPAKPTNWGLAVGEMSNKVKKAQGTIDMLKQKIQTYNSVGASTVELEKNLAQAKREQAEAIRDLARAYDNPYLQTRAGQINEEIFALQQEILELNNQANAVGGVVYEFNRLDGEKQELLKTTEDLKDKVNKYYDKQIEGSEKIISELEDQKTAHKSVYDEAKAAATDRHEKEMQQIETRHDRIISAIEDQIGKLREKGPAEKALEAYRLRELQQRRSAAGLSQKERLELDAQIERMTRQEQIERAQKTLANAKLAAEKEKVAKLKEQKSELDGMKKAYDSQLKNLNDLVTAQKEMVKQANAEREARIKALESAESKFGGLGESIEELDVLISQNIAEINKIGPAWASQQRAVEEFGRKVDSNKTKIIELKKELATAISDMNRLETAARRAASASDATRNSRRGTAFRAEGGPVSGGSKYTVNELGKEAFLSAAGKLSMINAPSWGTWKAPSSGTVIPAHLTSQLNIPSGGVNLAKAAGSAPGAKTGGGSLASVAQAIKTLAGAQGKVTNNVTIQSQNTTQAASDMLVELSRIKRSR